MIKITDMTLRKLTGIPGETQKVSIGSGLQLWVTINQAGKTAKVWYLRYYDADGKRQRSKLGEYPDMSLAKAMAAAEDAKAKAKDGINLAQEKTAHKRVKIEAAQTEQAQQGTTFEEVARTWLAKKSIDWEARHAKRQRERLEGNIFPTIGQLGINNVTMSQIDAALDVVVARGSRETAQRICTIIKSVFEYAYTLQLLKDPSILTLLGLYRKDMPQPLGKRHLYKEMGEEEIGKLMLSLEESRMRWTFSTSIALRIAPYLLVRPGELVGMQWAEIDMKNAEWYIPGKRMKAGKDHIVPLCRQALALLSEIRPYSGAHQYVFPSTRSGSKHLPIGTPSLIQALRRIGFASTTAEADSFTTHGFRGMASTTLHQHPAFSDCKSEWIEHQLAHVDKDKIRAAYNQLGPRSYLDERRKMLQAYADYLDGLKEGKSQ